MTEETLNIQITASAQDAISDIKKVQKSLKGIGSNATSSSKGISKISKSLNQVASASSKAKNSVESAMAGIKKSTASALKSIVALALSMASLQEGIDFAKLQSKLTTAFQSAGSSAAQATKTFQELYAFLGEDDRAVETAQNLARITTNTQELSEWTKILQGVYATMGDALPVESLAESVNETAQVAQVTGTLADALNWMGVSEDNVNTALANLNSSQEREAYLRELLNGLYSNAATIYGQQNKAIIQYNQSQAQLKATLADVATTLLPLITSFTQMAVVVINTVKPAIEVVVQVIATLVGWLKTAIAWLAAFFGIFSSGSDSAKSSSKSIDAATNSMNNYANAVGGAAAAAAELKRQTMGFDELNVMQSQTNSSGGGGGGGSIDTSGIDIPTVEMPDFDDFNAGLDESIKKVQGLIVALASVATAMWAISNWETIANGIIKATKGVTGYVNALRGSSNMQMALLRNVIASLSIIAGLYLAITGYSDAWANGMDASNLLQTITGIGLALGGVAALFSGLATAIGGVVASISVLVLSVHDIVENGANLTNILGVIVSALGMLASVLYLVSDKFATFIASIPNGNVAFAAMAAGAVLMVKALIDIAENGVTTENVIQLIIAALLIIIPLIYAVNTALTLNPIVAVITAVVAAVAAIALLVEAFTKERDGIKDVETAQEDLKQATEDLTNANNDYINSIDNAESAEQALIDAEKKHGISGEELFKQVQDGTLDYKDMTDAQKEVYKAYLKNEDAQNDLKESTEALRKAKKAETEASIENQLALAKEGNNYDEFKNKVVDAYQKGEISAEEARDYISRAMANMSKDSQQTFVKDLPNNLKSGLDPSKYQTWGTKLKNWFSTLWSDLGNLVKDWGIKIGEMIGGAIKSAINGVISKIESRINFAIGLINSAISLINLIPGVNVGKISKLSLPRLAKGGVVDSATIAMIGEQGKEAVVPLENNTEWMDKLADRITSRNATPTKLVLMVDGKELGWTTINNINNITKQTGNLPLVVI